MALKWRNLKSLIESLRQESSRLPVYDFARAQRYDPPAPAKRFRCGKSKTPVHGFQSLGLLEARLMRPRSSYSRRVK